MKHLKNDPAHQIAFLTGTPKDQSAFLSGGSTGSLSGWLILAALFGAIGVATHLWGKAAELIERFLPFFSM